MRYALALVCLLISGIAHADTAEDFKACLVGYSAIALDNGSKTASDAMNQASLHCPLPADPNDEIDVDAIADHALALVERMAAE